VEQYARYRAPAESGQKLISPAWNELGPLLAANQAWRRKANLSILGQSLTQFAAEARRELIDRATAYVASYHASGKTSITVGDRPLILTGHQPELVHPGVWLKNFAAAALARANGGLSLNLVIDGDACRRTALRVPTGSTEVPRLASIEFDGPAEEVPWEERTIVDKGLWRSFAERVRRDTSSLLPERMLDAWWHTAVERGEATGRIGASLAQARHLAELQWGQQNLELPQSAMCQTVAFRRFACHVLGHLPQFVEAYNGGLEQYRRVHGIRNHAQPVPNLADRSPWLQAPFWVWSHEAPRRSSVYVRPEGSSLLVSDRRTFERPLPLADGDGEAAVEELGRWEREGVKLRSRALVTTMFARLALADLFIHGIGGAKYDEATDAICQRFFGTPPPRFAAISGTLRLPIARTGSEDDGAQRLRQRLRELQFHPEESVKLDGAAAGAKMAEQWITQKRRWVQTAKTPARAAERHAAIVTANRALQPFVEAERSAVEAQLDRASERSRADRILNSREYAFCLFPRNLLEQFLLDFPQQLL
jgi:hypothetical protein